MLPRRLALSIRLLLLAFTMQSVAACAQTPEPIPDLERATQIVDDELQHFIFIGGAELSDHEDLLARDDISGVQIVYNWRRLEPREGEYRFDKIERELALADKLGKRLFIQLQDRFFLPESRYLPDYILTEPKYGGGLVRQEDNAGEGKAKGSGWVAAQWNPELRVRFQSLLTALGERFDGRIYGLNLPETAIEVPIREGAPDIIPYRRAQEKNAYQFLESKGDQLPVVAMAVQAPTLTYTNPETGRKFTRAEFEEYAVSKLNVDIIFWSLRTPWLKRN